MAEETLIASAPRPTNAVKPLALTLKHLCNDWFSSRADFESGLTLESSLEKCTTADQLLATLELLYHEITTGLKADSLIHESKPSTLVRFCAFDSDEGCFCSEVNGFNTLNDDFVAAYETFLAFPKVEQNEAAWLVVCFWKARKSRTIAA